jgi:hypothetical protein
MRHGDFHQEIFPREKLARRVSALIVKSTSYFRIYQSLNATVFEAN